MTYEEIVKKQQKQEIAFYHEFWKQYIELEKLFLETEKYVAINDKNFKTYSIQYNILLQAICAEVDVVIKRFCFEFDNTTNIDDMYKYVNFILLHMPNLVNKQVNMQLYDLNITPWKGIGFRRNNKGKEFVIPPYWWDGYIKIKHRRITFSKNDNEYKILERNMVQANQKNVLGALAGLFVLEIECLNKMRERFKILFENAGYPTVEAGLDMFNNSIFQQELNIFEGF